MQVSTVESFESETRRELLCRSGALKLMGEVDVTGIGDALEFLQLAGQVLKDRGLVTEEER